MKDVIVKSEFSIRLLNDGSFLDVYAMPKDNTPFDMRCSLFRCCMLKSSMFSLY